MYAFIYTGVHPVAWSRAVVVVVVSEVVLCRLQFGSATAITNLRLLHATFLIVHACMGNMLQHCDKIWLHTHIQWYMWHERERREIAMLQQLWHTYVRWVLQVLGKRLKKCILFSTYIHTAIATYVANILVLSLLQCDFGVAIACGTMRKTRITVSLNG